MTNNRKIVSNISEISFSVTDENAEAAECDEDEEQLCDMPWPALKNTQEPLNVFKCYFLKKGGLSELDCVLAIINITSSKQTTITDFFFKKHVEKGLTIENDDSIAHVD